MQYLSGPMQRQFEFYGRHLLLNFSGCQADLNDLELIRESMVDAVKMVGATILSQLEHQFDPHGVSVVLMLSESHASVHTYPEYNACFLDIFTCGQMPVERFGDALEQLWKPTHVSRQLHERFDPSFDPSVFKSSVAEQYVLEQHVLEEHVLKQQSSGSESLDPNCLDPNSNLAKQIEEPLLAISSR
jgi:S-adenosylmethionine decarboxylase